MPALTPEQLDHVARIARLPLGPEERERLLAEAERILAQFGEVEAALARPAPAPVAHGLAARDDAAREPDPGAAERIAAQFPRREGALCKVPEGL
ncbi:MAG: aspartyl/glutamyl-tRNA amidotransferase subunit C [Halobacteriales archaeon]|nr:aspartyl/glutamyl-tRNA amidotransferase subunit C [Halobacteriales archaeon]